MPLTQRQQELKQFSKDTAHAAKHERILSQEPDDAPSNKRLELIMMMSDFMYELCGNIDAIQDNVTS